MFDAERLVAERATVKYNLLRLEKLEYSTEYLQLTEIEKDLIKEQVICMTRYISILDKRIFCIQEL